MPIHPYENEEKNQFIKRCIKTELDAGKEQDEAIAICMTAWNDNIKKSKVKKEYFISIIKIDNEEKHIITGIVLEPDTIDSQGDKISAKEIEKVSNFFMINLMKLENVHIVENYIAPINFYLNDNQIKKGTWIMSIKILDNNLWNLIKNDYFSDFSIVGYGVREVEKNGISSKECND